MNREQILEDALVELVEHVRGLHNILSSVMIDAAAVRRTLLLDPGDTRAYASNSRAGAKIAKPLLNTAMRSYNEIIERLRLSGEPESESPESLPAKPPLLQ